MSIARIPPVPSPIGATVLVTQGAASRQERRRGTAAREPPESALRPSCRGICWYSQEQTVVRAGPLRDPSGGTPPPTAPVALTILCRRSRWSPAPVPLAPPYCRCLSSQCPRPASDDERTPRSRSARASRRTTAMQVFARGGARRARVGADHAARVPAAPSFRNRAERRGAAGDGGRGRGDVVGQVGVGLPIRY